MGKETSKNLGYAHVQYQTVEDAASAVELRDGKELKDRIVRIALAKKGEKFQFELPVNIREDIRGLEREAYEGKNISAIKDAWQKRHPGQKLDACKWGFKNFSHAMQTVEGVRLEKHIEKTLTFLAFLEGSPAHQLFLEQKQQREVAAAAAAEKAQASKSEAPASEAAK